MDCKEINPKGNLPVLNIHWKDWCWNWNSNTLATWCEELTHWKRPWRWVRLKKGGEGTTEDEMLGWHHWLNGQEFEQALGVGDGQGSLACYSPWDHKQSDRTEQLNWTEKIGGLDRSNIEFFFFFLVCFPFRSVSFSHRWTSLVAQTVKRLPTMQETWVQSLGQDLLEKEMESHSSILAWKIPWTEKPGRLQSTESQRIRHDLVPSLHFCIDSCTYLQVSLVTQMVKNLPEMQEAQV